MKKLISLILAALLLGGCANTPQVQNAAVGTVLGGAVGALLGDSSKAARIGAGLGLLGGVLLPTQQSQPVYNNQPVYGQAGTYPNQVPYGGGQSYLPTQQIRESCAWVGPGQYRCAGCPVDRHYDGRGCAPGSYGRNTMVPNQQHPGAYPGGSVPSAQQPGVYQVDPATCPRVQLGGGRWRCQ